MYMRQHVSAFTVVVAPIIACHPSRFMSPLYFMYSRCVWLKTRTYRMRGLTLSNNDTPVSRNQESEVFSRRLQSVKRSANAVNEHFHSLLKN